MEGIFIKKVSSFISIHEAPYRETKAWLSKCNRRNIGDSTICSDLITEAEKIMTMLNAFIKFVAQSQQKPKPKQLYFPI